MSVLRFTDDITHRRVLEHLTAGAGERFAFLLCRAHVSADGPSLAVEDAMLVEPSQVVMDRDGWSLTNGALDDVINRAAATGQVLVEAHNHRFGPPRFSSTDRAGLEPFAAFVLDSFPDRPYGATVWADGQVYGEWFERGRDGRILSRAIDRVVLIGQRLEVLTVAQIGSSEDAVSARQSSVFGVAGLQTLRQLRVAIVGLGGTGSHMAVNLAYLGVRDFVLIDDDHIEVTNLNRLVTATFVDLDTPKVVAARRIIEGIAPDAAVSSVLDSVKDETSSPALTLSDADLIVGCVDDDGPRLLLNRIAVDKQIPYLDIATGITVHCETTVEAGGRIAFTLPGGPCLGCTGELDVNEVRSYFLSSDEHQRARAYGYITGNDMPAPAVVSLNGLAVHVALNELSLWVAGIRAPAARTDIDLLGNGDPLGLRVAPRRGASRCDDCVECGDQV